MPEESDPMDFIRRRYPAWMKCHTCHKPLHDHSFEEFKVCHNDPQVYAWLKHNVRPNPNKNPGGALIGNKYIRPADPNAEDAWKKVAKNKHFCARIAQEECEVCHRKFGEHSEDEVAVCLEEIARRTEQERLAKNAREEARRRQPCAMCGRAIGEHTPTERTECAKNALKKSPPE